MRSPEDLWADQPGDYFVISTKSKTGKWKDYPIQRGDWDRVDYLLDQFEDRDLYMCPHGFSGKTGRREKAYAVIPHMLYADLDGADPRDLAIRPTIAIQSSPGRYVGYWLTDGPTSEDLNKRLAYQVGADKSGWDLTQVLRIPGTKNYKYNPAPRVKLLWADGPHYNVKTLEKMLTPLPADESVAQTDNEALAVYKAYERHLSRWARKELLEGNPRNGHRSEILWKLQNELLEAGASSDEIFVLLWASPWNKFRDRRGGEDQLRREIAKNLSRRVSGKKVDEEREKSDIWNPLPQSIKEVERVNVEWVLPGLLARKEITIVEGDPGVGKSYLVQIIAASICDGKQLPLFGKYTPAFGKVAYFDTENTAGTVTKARLEENGLVHMDHYFQGEDAFSIDDEERWQLVLDRLEQMRPEIVVFDTINTYIGGSDTYRSSDTQQAMGFFKHIAQSLNCSVVLLRHLTKGGKDKAIYRGQGSIAFTGAARIVASVSDYGTEDEDERMRIVTCTKSNLGAFFKAFTYTILPLPDNKRDKNRSRLVWGIHVNETSDSIFTDKAKEGGKPGEKKDDPPKQSELAKAKELTLEIIKRVGKIKLSELVRRLSKKTISKEVTELAAQSLDLEFYDVGGVEWIRRRTDS